MPTPTQPHDKSDPKRAGGGKTHAAQDGEPKPRLPHEHDQSSDSQSSADGEPTKVGRQAARDIDRGMVDTDRGPVVDRVYNDKVKR